MHLKAGVMRLHPEDARTQEGRTILLTKELSESLKNATIYLDVAGHRVPYIFTYAGRRIDAACRLFETACRHVGLADIEHQ